MHNKRHHWTKEEINTALDLYNSGLSVKEISQKLNTTTGAIYGIFKHCNIKLDIRSQKDCRFSADYHSYDWCYQRYIIERKSYEEMAAEAKCKPRTIQKWCSEVHRLNQWTISSEIHLSDIQRRLVMFSLLGDGHISKTGDNFIVSHSVRQKDYLFWKYEILKNLCHSAPTFYDAKLKTFSNKSYKSQSFYRITTRKLDELHQIGLMSKIEIISQIDELGLALHFLDDGSFSNNYWSLCYAAFTDNEKELYCKTIQNRFNITPHLRKDKRYIGFSKIDSQKINQIILNQIPNDLDIIKYKILKE